jgi:Spy/CpxP family protein refolding chaperone
MGRKTTGLIMMWALVLSVAAVSSALADSGKEDGGPRFSNSPFGRMVIGNIGRLLVLRSELNVTDEQRKNIAAEIKSHKNDFGPLAKDIFARRQALREAVLNKPGDEKAIMAAANDLGKAIGNAAILASKVAAKVKPMLTEDQQERLKNFKTGSDSAINSWIDQIGK